ncbi:MAG TPA: RNA 2'-phosphotransferase [Lacunisphaera sp.]|nr:RNA 2'-phosphotransferase [Lacunisphaera sp.]
MNDLKLSKFLSLVLRHEPGRLGLALDAAGWVGVDELLAACAREEVPLTRAKLEQLVAASDKQRFAFDATRTRIRASQGHSVAVELGYEPKAPPETLFHGTVEKFLPSIRAQGLVKGQRHHVHLSPDAATARKVGQRRGQPVVLTVQSGAMHRAGHKFFLSANGVWLVEAVPPGFVREP